MNVLMLVVDSLRRDFCYGSTTETPTVDTLAEDGTRFEQAISGATWTPPSMSSIFSGIYPHRLGMFDFDTPYPDEVEPLFSHFRDAGYDVGSFVFDEQHLFKNVPEANVVDNFRDYSRPLEWISDHADEEFFLFVHHYWVHGPYEPQDSAESWSEENDQIKRELRNDHETAVEKYRQKYAWAVEEMSENWLRKIVERLEAEGILDETLIVFTGDHGESWGERYDDKSQITANFHLHGELLYDELIRVPLILRYPPEIPEGREVQSQVRHVDLFPTIMEMADLEPGRHEWKRDGESLRRVLDAKNIGTRPAISAATDVEIEQLEKLSVRYPDQKLIWTMSDDRFELYDLEDDPGEACNIADECPERAGELKSILTREKERASQDIGAVGEGVKGRLEDLGYL